MADSLNWRIEVARASFFLSRPVQANTPERWWGLLVGGQPKEHAAQPEQGRYQWGGEIPDPALGSAMLRLEYNSNDARVDWLLLPAPTARIDEGQFRTLGLYRDCAPAFEQRVGGWLRQIQPSVRMTRIAFGAVLLYAPADPARLFAEVSRLLPLSEQDFPSRDFLFQANRRRGSAAFGAQSMVNRLSKWSTATLSGIDFNVATNTATQVQGETVIRLEVDINTDPASSPRELPRESLVRHFDELTAMAREIAENGDIP